MAGNAGQAAGPVACGIGLRPAEFGRRDSARMNAHKRIAIFQRRLRRIFVDELLRAAARMEADGFHGPHFRAVLKGTVWCDEQSLHVVAQRMASNGFQPLASSSFRNSEDLLLPNRGLPGIQQKILSTY